ncbi:MAG: hypothetical protein RPS47_15610 [Colwellia sp.]
MYKEVALDPSCMGNIEYYNLVKQHFGFDHGRYVSSEVKVWAKEAMGHVKQAGMQPIKEKSVKNFLNKIVRTKSVNEFHLAEDRKKITCDSWADWIIEQKEVRPFSATISEDAGTEGITIEDINAGCGDWVIKPSISVDRCAEELVGVIKPLLNISKSITLVDQYFRLAENNTFRALLIAVSASNLDKLTVVSSMDTPGAIALFQREYSHLKRDGLVITWLKAPDRFFHDRYVIGEVGAIRSGHGFMEDIEKGIHADKANLNMISKEEADRTLNDLQSLLDSGEVTEVLKV